MLKSSAIFAPQSKQQFIRCFAKKAKKPAKSTASSPSSDKGLNDVLMRGLKGRYKEGTFSEEELEAHHEIGRKFNRETMIRHNHFMADMQNKINLKRYALDALPDRLREEALFVKEVEDPVNHPSEKGKTFPDERWIATLTPPIEGYRRFKLDDDDDNN